MNGRHPGQRLWAGLFDDDVGCVMSPSSKIKAVVDAGTHPADCLMPPRTAVAVVLRNPSARTGSQSQRLALLPDCSRRLRHRRAAERLQQ